MAYNGWKNWETWNVGLWLGNDEGIYRQALRMIRSHIQHRVDATLAEKVVRELMPQGTPDFQSEHHGNRKGAKLYAEVDWDEVADSLNEMAGYDEEDEGHER